MIYIGKQLKVFFFGIILKHMIFHSNYLNFYVFRTFTYLDFFIYFKIGVVYMLIKRFFKGEWQCPMRKNTANCETLKMDVPKKL